MGGAVGVVLAPAEERDPARADEAAIQDVVVVRADLRLTGPLLEPRLRAALLHRAAPEHGRRDAVEHRRLVQLDERVRVEPMPAGRVPAVDQRDVHIGVIDQRVGERHAHRARADDEIVGLQRSHRQRILRGRRIARGLYGAAMPKITVLLDSPPTAPYHAATTAALRHAIDPRADRASFTIDAVNTDAIDTLGDAVVVGPGTPYRDPRAAEDAITAARDGGIPLVAT